jgi:chloramphenicol-sensitive protein RarD
MPSGVLYAALAYTMWGLFPLYFKQIAAVPALEIVLHRSVWSLAFLLVVLAVLKRWDWLRALCRQPRRLLPFVASALLLSVNWLIYVWAINSERVIDASLGYFITPLVNVLLGTFALHERPRPVQWLALALAALGVLWLTLQAGQWPWIALVIAASFGVYGLLRKTAPLGALEGLTLETMVLAPLALPLLAWWTASGTSALAHGFDAALAGWLLLAGPLTALPLLLFAAGARRITLTTLGLLQYIGPSIQFGLGVWLFGEPFARDRAIGFGLIWLALAAYSADSAWAMRRSASPVTAPPAPAQRR